MLNNIRTFTLLTFLSSALPSSPFAAARCHAEKMVEHEFKRENFTVLHLNALAGKSHVRGNDADKMVISGKACSNKQQYLDRINACINEDSPELTFKLIIPFSDHDFDASYAYMDIDLPLRHLNFYQRLKRQHFCR